MTVMEPAGSLERSGTIPNVAEKMQNTTFCQQAGSQEKEEGFVPILPTR